MKIPDRIIRLAIAMSIIGIVAAQVPTRLSVATAATRQEGGGGNNEGGGNDEGPVQTAQDGYPSNAVLTTRNIILAGALAATAGGAVGAGAGGSIRGAVLSSAGVYDITLQHPNEFDIIAKIIRNAEMVNTYRASEKTTVFWPTNEAIVRSLGADAAAALQKSPNQAQAKQFLQSLTVMGSYSLSDLKAAAGKKQALQTVAGQSIVLTMSGDKLLANGVELIGTEYAASNGSVLVANGVISKE